MDWLIYDWILNPRAVLQLLAGVECWWVDFGRWVIVYGLAGVYGLMGLSGFMGVENGQDSV